MLLIRNGKETLDDCPILEDEALIPPNGHCCISVGRWERERADLLQFSGAIGIYLASTDDVEVLAHDVRRFQLVVLAFDTAGAGQHFSNAWLLRKRYNYGGEIRATGAVYQDQLFYLARCGVNAFVLDDDTCPEVFSRHLKGFSYSYQGAADDRAPIYRHRLGFVRLDTTATPG